MRRLLLVIIACMAFLSVILYYGYYRLHALPALLSWLPPLLPGADRVAGIVLPGGLSHSLPSLLHALSAGLLAQAVLPPAPRTRRLARLLLFVVLSLTELTFGVFDINDMLAIILGLLLSECIAFCVNTRPSSIVSTRRWPAALVITGAAVSAMGSYYLGDGYAECARYSADGPCIEYKKAAEPIYMDYRTLRDAVRTEAARPPDNLGRIYLYQDYLFLNERNQGIHVIDNRTPQAPVNIGFIRIPGNTELAIRNSYLYADSYVDLVTLDVSDPANIAVVDRQEDIFPYDAFQNIPYNISLNRYATDRQRGVIVGYRLTGD